MAVLGPPLVPKRRFRVQGGLGFRVRPWYQNDGFEFKAGCLRYGLESRVEGSGLGLRVYTMVTLETKEPQF